MFASAALALALGSPVPEHLMRPAPDPVRPGYRWWYAGHELVVVAVEGDVVTFRDLTDPGMVWPALDGFREPSTQSRVRVRKEAVENLQTPRFDPSGPWWFDRQ